MILHPAIISLLLSSLLITGLVLYSSYHGFRILRAWDIRSGSELQLVLERKTYLISTILAYVFSFQLVSLFLFIYTADGLCTLFTGAMCAAGTLAVNSYGYPVLALKILNFFAAGLWLIMNHVDGKAYDYPLIKSKYVLLLLIAPLIASEAWMQMKYFLTLSPDVITSCCGSLFSEHAESVPSDIAAFPVAPMTAAFFLSDVLAMAAGFVFWKRGKGGSVFALLCAVLFFVTAASILSFISLYIYELPTHHCPFCILQKEYGYVGYLLYGVLFGSTLAGLGVGILMPFRGIGSLETVLPRIQKKLAMVSVVLAALLGLLVLYRIAISNVRLME
jgi:hypothetical protein